MNEVCPRCGLPLELCVCETIAREAQKIQISTEKKRYGKVSTIIQGLNSKEVDVKDIAKKLKSELACGGTVKDDIVELQGNHRTKVKGILVKMGFSSSQIIGG